MPIPVPETDAEAECVPMPVPVPAGVDVVDRAAAAELDEEEVAVRSMARAVLRGRCSFCADGAW